MAVYLPGDSQLCFRCLFMTSTSEGLGALDSLEGFVLYKCGELVESSVRGCMLCTWIWDCSTKKYWSKYQIGPADKFRLRWIRTQSSHGLTISSRGLLPRALENPNTERISKGLERFYRTNGGHRRAPVQDNAALYFCIRLQGRMHPTLTECC